MKRVRILLDVLASMALLGAMMFGTAGRASAATIIYVKANASGLHNGTSWANAYRSLQVALTHAVSGEQVWVAMGTYKPTASTDRTVSFLLKNGVAIYGGFAGTETLLSQRDPPVNVTILSGDIGTPNDASDNSYHVVQGNGTNSTAVLDGFTITLGNASLMSTTNGEGGGMFNASSSPTLGNLVFLSNTAATDGGGMHNDFSNPKLTSVRFVLDSAFTGGGMWNYQSAPTLTNVIFSSNSATDGGAMTNVAAGNPMLNNVLLTGNTASGNGGGIYNSGGVPIIKGTKINFNTAVNGGGIYNENGSNPTLTTVLFNSNGASSNGGGMYNLGSSPTLVNAIFVNNTASFGGGIYNLNNSSPMVRGATLSANSAANDGGGIYNDGGSSPNLKNMTFYGNTAAAGGGMYNDINSSPTLTNVTFSANSATSVGGMVDNSNSNPLVQDSIFWGDGTPEISDSSSAPVINDSIVQTGCSNGGTCSNVSLADPKLGPLQNNGGFEKTMALTAGSSAIDAGNIATCAKTDERGVSRPQGGACDIGAYEVRAIQFISQAAYDGQVLESATVNGVGGAVDSTSTVFHVGDNLNDRRYRGFLSFDTTSLPDAATIVMATARVRQQAAAVGTPFATLGSLKADLGSPYFGTSVGLVSTDWQAGATVPAAGTWMPDASFFWMPLSNAGLSHINKLGTTQIRLRFTLTDTNHAADYITLYSGNAGTAANRPTLTVYYNP